MDAKIDKGLEDIATCQEYIKANNLDVLLISIQSFLRSRDEYKGFDYKNIYQSLSYVIDNYHRGNICACLDELYKLLIKRIGTSGDDFIWNLKTDKLKSGSITYRMRSQEGYHQLNPTEMFHIPYDMMKQVPNSRYSINGFPCLYLGASLYSCWEELRRPDLFKVNYVGFKNMESLKLLSITCPRDLNDENGILQFFIFSLCSHKVNEDENKYKFEYVFPELILQLLIKMNQKQIKNHYDGIKYISSRYYDDQEIFKVRSVFYNYVIPTCSFKTKGYCRVLIKMFEVSNVLAHYIHEVKLIALKKNKVRPNNYSISFFKQLEDEIENGTFKRMSSKISHIDKEMP
jgi:hypothetical protein